MTNVSIPIKNGNGASRTSAIALGNIGINTFFQQRGKRNDIRATAE